MKIAVLSRVNHWWGDLPLRWKGVTVLLIPVTALICGFTSVYLVGVKENAAETWVYHTGAVRYHIRGLLTAVLDAETGVRGFIISRDPQFLDLYDNSLKTFPRNLRELTNLVADNPSQTARLTEIRALAEERLDLLSKVISDAKNSDETPRNARELQFIGRGKKLMDELRPKLVAMEQEETGLEDIRNRELQKDRELSARVIGLSAIVGVLGGIAGMALFSHGIVRRTKAIQLDAERLAKELPLDAASDRRDEIGKLGRRLREASDLLGDKKQALRESESRLQAVLDNAPSVMYVKDLDGKFILVNRAFATLLERPKEEIVGKTGYDIYPAHEAEIFEANDRAALEAGQPVQSEETLKCKDGLHTFISSKFPLIDATGKAYALGGISTDISERARNAAALASAKAEAERASDAKSEFLSRMSHELRTPLNAILGFAQLLELRAKTAGDCECVDQILTAGRHLLGLINEVLDISRIESGGLSISNEAVELGEVVEECIQLITPLAKTKNVSVTRSPSALWSAHVLADRQRSTQVLLNLLSNAVNYNRQNGSVTVACQRSDEKTIRLLVRDTGVGIAPASLKRLFQPFDRLQSISGEGAGLGLTLCKRLIEIMGGRIGVESKPGEGAVFWIELPETESPVVQFERGETKSVDLRDKVRTHEKTLLYIEDNLSNLRLIEHILENQPQIKLISAMEGGPGVDLALEHSPDLVLLDLNLPDISGFEVLQRLRREPRTIGTPVVVVSADATARQIDRLMTAGATEYLVKPIDVKKFVSVVDQILGATEAQTA